MAAARSGDCTLQCKCEGRERRGDKARISSSLETTEHGPILLYRLMVASWKRCETAVGLAPRMISSMVTVLGPLVKSGSYNTLPLS